MECIFCDRRFCVQKTVGNNGDKSEVEKLKKHLLDEHRFIISDISEIADLDEYFSYWRNVRKNGSLKNHCAVTFINKENEANRKSYLMLCPDIVPLDKDLRQRLLNNKPKREIVAVTNVVVAGPQKHFKKQALRVLENGNDIDFTAVKTANTPIINKDESKPHNGCSTTDVKTANPPVRNKDERKLLNGYGCTECLDYYGSLDLPGEQLRERLDKCSRHRAQYSPPKTPPHFWDISIPSTQECKQNGWLS